jgi:peptidoglycan/xylan/chitin deacetylase (PgdA/CDA1 family)
LKRLPGRISSALADVDESYGFRSSFNFVPEKYWVDESLLDELRERGFEVGVHGLNHDGKLFSSQREFERRAARINAHARDWGAVGFRAPFTHRNPEWMQVLDVEYDASFFDTDPFEPIPGGTMSIWPFMCGRFVELPYTLVQDHTLLVVLGERSPRMWLDKVDFIARWNGMALVNVHPDYMRDPRHLGVYEQFLSAMARFGVDSERAMMGAMSYWHALPRDVARWWRRTRFDASGRAAADPAGVQRVTAANDREEIYR